MAGVWVYFTVHSSGCGVEGLTPGFQDFGDLGLGFGLFSKSVTSWIPVQRVFHQGLEEARLRKYRKLFMKDGHAPATQPPGR